MNSKVSTQGELLVNPGKKHKIPTEFIFGTVIGQYMNVNIYDKITDNHGIVRRFQGVTQSKPACKLGGVILRPGIIYEPS